MSTNSCQRSLWMPLWTLFYIIEIQSQRFPYSVILQKRVGGTVSVLDFGIEEVERGRFLGKYDLVKENSRQLS